MHNYQAMDRREAYLFSVIYKEDPAQPPMYAHAVLPRASHPGWNPIVCGGTRPAMPQPTIQKLQIVSMQAVNGIDPAKLQEIMQQRAPIIVQIASLDPLVRCIETGIESAPAVIQEEIRKDQQDLLRSGGDLLVVGYMMYDEDAQGANLSWVTSALGVIVGLTAEEKANQNAEALLAELDAEEEEKMRKGGSTKKKKQQEKALAPPPPPLPLEAAESAAEEFICRLTKRIMENPMLVTDGFSYEGSALEQLVKEAKGGMLVSPTTGEPIHPFAVPNHLLRNMIQDWKASNR